MFGGLFGGGRRSGRRSSGRGGFDWGAQDEDEEGYADDRGSRYDYEEDEAPRRGRRGRRKAPTTESVTLMSLCTPVFGFAAVLPQEEGQPEPSYEQFRGEVVGAINRIESEAAKHGIEVEDAKQAGYALCLFMDEQVGQSEWSAKMQWMAEPLHIMMQQDAEGGVNFFRRLESFGDREREVKEVYLVCLALGFRGKYAEMEATEQAAAIGEIRQKLVRGIHRVPLEKQDELFPEGYRPAADIEDDIPPPPRWWLFASLGTVAVALVLWFILFWAAGRSPRPAQEALRNLTWTVPAVEARDAEVRT